MLKIKIILNIDFLNYIKYYFLKTFKNFKIIKTFYIYLKTNLIYI